MTLNQYASNVKKILSIIAVLLLSILIAEIPAIAESQLATPSPSPKSSPSPPEFTAKFVASSLEVTIKNQPLADYADANGSNPSLYYGFRFKDHENIQDWNYAPIYYVGSSSYGSYYKASTSDYTVVSFPLGSYPLTGILGSGQVDLQVMALIGNEVPTNYENGTVYGFDGVESVWSSTQTITVPVSSASPSEQNRALAFIENVLPIDSSQWHIELKVDGNATDSQVRQRLDINNISVGNSDNVLIYFLGSMVGTADSLEVILVIGENNFYQGIVDIENAPSYNSFGRQLEVANITTFLANYQSWSGSDSTKMIETLSNVDIAQNTRISSGNLMMSINRTDASTAISWVFQDSRTFNVSFQNNFPISFYDDRQINSIIPTPTPLPTINTGEEPPKTEPFPITIVATVTLVVVLAVAAGLLVYLKKRRPKSGGKT